MESKLPDWEYGTWDRKNLMLIASADFLWQYDNMLKKKNLHYDSREIMLKYLEGQACTMTMRSILNINS